MTKIFISHSSSQDPAGGEVVTWLREKGHEPFLDHDLNAGIVAGQDWEQTLYTELRRCRALIVLLSDDWLRSPWCVTEANYAQALDKPVMTVAIAEISEELETFRPPVLRRDQGIRAFWPSDDAKRRLLRGLEEAGLDHRTGRQVPDRAPYPGLPPFMEEDAPFFFARDDDVSHLAARLDRLQAPGRERMMIIQGASGTGKSSILRAGLLPRLKRMPERWIVLQPLRPGRTGPAVLAETLAAELGPAFEPRKEGESWGDWLVTAASRLRVAHKRTEATVVLSIDQLEEALAGDANPEGDALLLAIRDALAVSDHRLIAIATLRADFIGTLDRHKALREPAPGAADVLPTSRHSVQPLPRSGLFEVIRRPAELVGLGFDDGLVERLVAETGNEDALPLLAFALRELWEQHGKKDLHVSTADYENFGGIEKAVGTAAEQALTDLRPDPRELGAFRTLLLFRLADIAQSGRITRLAIGEETVDPDARRLVDAFVAARLFLTREATVEVAHEALFRNWERLRGWIGETRDDLAAKSRVRAAYETWHDAADEQKSERLLPSGLAVEEGRRLLALPGILTEADLRDYVQRSVGIEDRRVHDEQERQKRELEQERQAAEAARRAAAEAERAAAAERKLAVRRWRQTAAAAVGLLIQTAIAAWAVSQWKDASDARALAQANLEQANRALATSIWNDLSMADSDALDARERVALWQLAVGRPALASPFLAEWAAAPDRSIRFARKPEAILRALAGPPGLTPDQAAAALDKVLGAIAETTDRGQLQTLAEAVDALAPKLDAAQATAALDKVLAAMAETTDPSRLAALAEAVAALAPTPDQAAAALDPVLAAIPRRTKAIPRRTDPFSLPALAQAVATLAPKLDAPQAAAALDTVLATIARTYWPPAIQTLAQAVAALAPIPDQAVAALDSVLATIAQTTDPHQLAALAQAVAALAPKLDAPQAAAALDTVLATIAQTTDPYQLAALAQAVAALAPKLDAPQAAAALDTVLATIAQTTDPYQLAALAQAVAALSPKLDAPQAAAALDRVLAAIAQKAGSFALAALAQAVAALAPAPDQAAAALDTVLATIAQTTDPDQLAALAQAVAALAPAPDQAAAALDSVLATIAQTTGSDQLAALAQAVAALAPTPDQAAAALDSVLAAIAQTYWPPALQTLAAAVAALAPKLDASHAAVRLDGVRRVLAWAPTAELAASSVEAYVALAKLLAAKDRRGRLVEALGFPTSVGPAGEALLAALGDVGGPGRDAGLDATVAWLRQARPEIDLAAPPTCPQPPARWTGLRCPEPIGAAAAENAPATRSGAAP